MWLILIEYVIYRSRFNNLPSSQAGYPFGSWLTVSCNHFGLYTHLFIASNGTVPEMINIPGQRFGTIVAKGFGYWIAMVLCRSIKKLNGEWVCMMAKSPGGGPKARGGNKPVGKRCKVLGILCALIIRSEHAPKMQMNYLAWYLSWLRWINLKWISKAGAPNKGHLMLNTWASAYICDSNFPRRLAEFRQPARTPGVLSKVSLHMWKWHLLQLLQPTDRQFVWAFDSPRRLWLQPFLLLLDPYLCTYLMAQTGVVATQFEKKFLC